MAIDDPEDDLEQDNEETKKPKKKGGFLKILIISFVSVLLIGGTVAGTMYFTGSLAAMTGDMDESEDSDKKSKKKKKKKSKKANKGPPLYLPLEPPFVVNFVENNQIRYLQVTVDAMTRNENTLEDIETHLPLIRNNLIILFSNQSYATLSSTSGMQKLRAEALAEVKKILKAETGDPGVEELYFTSYVMQ